MEGESTFRGCPGINRDWLDVMRLPSAAAGHELSPTNEKNYGGITYGMPSSLLR